MFAKEYFRQTNYAAGDAVSLPKDEVINEDYFAAGKTVILDGTVNGDAYIVGGNVIVEGTVNGDVLTAGGNVTIGGKVSGNVRVAGGQVVISGEVGRNITAAGGSVTVERTASISGSLAAVSGNLSLLAPIGKGATIAGKQVTIDSSIGGNVTGAVGQLDVLQSASIAGKLTYWSNSRANIANYSVRDGISYHYADWKAQKEQHQSIAKNMPPTAMLTGFSLMWTIISLITSFVVGLMLLYFVPAYTKAISTTLMTRPWASLGVGFLAVVLTPIAFIVLLITVIGVPVAFILLFSFIIFALLSSIFIAYTIGKKLLPQYNVLALLAGLIITQVINIIPVIGWIWGLAVLFFGIGTIAIVEKQLYITLKEKKMI